MNFTRQTNHIKALSGIGGNYVMWTPALGCFWRKNEKSIFIYSLCITCVFIFICNRII